MADMLLNSATFRHVPACDYDSTEECFFSEAECYKGLLNLPKMILRKLLSRGVQFISKEWYYEIGRSDKYCDLVVTDADGNEVAVVDSSYDPDLDPGISDEGL